MALIDKASLLMVPSTYEAGKLYNVLPSGNRAPDSTDQNSGYDQTRADFDFDRGSNAAATRVNPDGVLQKYRENLLLQSNQFDTTWVNFNTSDTSGQSGYDGSSNAWKLSNTGASGYIRQTSLTASGVQTFSIYAKAGSLNWLRVTSQSGNVKFNVNLSDGTIGTTGSLVIEAKAASIGDGWYRCSMAFNASTTGIYIYPATNDDDTTQTSGSVYIQNTQLESGLVSTDYLDSTSVTGKAGVLVDLPRINFDANGENGSLLLEPSRQNLATYSELFGSSYYLNAADVDVTYTPNYGTSPEGVKNSTRVQFANDTAFSYRAVSLSADNTASLYVKGTSGEKIRFGFGTSVAGGGVIHTFDGTWQRVVHTASSGTQLYLSSYTNDNQALDFEIYGLQHEAGSYASSYIPTMGTTETRAADNCSVTGASDVIGQTEGTIFAEFDSSQFLTGSYIGISDGNATHRQIFGWEAQSGDSGTLRLYGFWNGFAYSSFSKGQKIKVALAYKNNDFALYVNGTQAGTKTSGTISGTLSQFGFNSGGGSQKYQGNAYQLALFKERLSNAELATLTTL